MLVKGNTPFQFVFLLRDQSYLLLKLSRIMGTIYVSEGMVQP